MFGGYNDVTNSGFGDTWEWDGATWEQSFASPAPDPRWVPEMVYDSIRGVTVLFGGWDGTQLWGDTWEWDGNTWSLRATTGPQPRDGHKMAFDSARGVTVLFGGWHNSYDGETWEWDGSTWTQRATTGPNPRQTHAMTYDVSRGVTVLFGGFFYDGSLHYYGDTWEWDGTTWSLRATDGPGQRIKHAMAYDSLRRVSVQFGGHTAPFDGSTLSNETWEWDGATWTQRLPGTNPSPRAESPLVYDDARKEVVMFGGQTVIAGDLAYLADTSVFGTNCVDSSCGNGVIDSGEECDDGNTLGGDGCSSACSVEVGFECTGEPSVCTDVPDPATPGPGTFDRFVELVLPASSAGIETAYRVTLSSLYHPADPQPTGQNDYSASEGQVRYLNRLLDGNNQPTTDCQSSAAFLTSYKCATLGCEPEYADWGTLFGGASVFVTGNAVIPDSAYTVSHLSASCAGNEVACAIASAEVGVVTARHGNTNADSDGFVNVTDIVKTVDVVKQTSTAFLEYRVYIRNATAPQQQTEATNVTDIVLHVDAVKLKAYPFLIATCP